MNGFYEYVKMAVQNIRANKGRSFLTMLGIIIGIASVIAIVSIGEGTKNQMNSEISDIGGGQVYIYVSNDAITEQEWITPEDINAVRDLESVEGVSVAESYDGETVTGKGNFNLMVTAEGPDPKMVNNADMKYGNYFGEREVEEAKPVCAVSYTHLLDHQVSSYTGVNTSAHGNDCFFLHGIFSFFFCCGYGIIINL